MTGVDNLIGVYIRIPVFADPKTILLISNEVSWEVSNQPCRSYVLSKISRFSRQKSVGKIRAIIESILICACIFIRFNVLKIYISQEVCRMQILDILN